MIKILKYTANQKDAIFLSSPTIQKNRILFRKGIIEFGAWRKEMDIVCDDQLPPDTIGISDREDIPFQIPDHLSYDIIIEKRVIKIGPVIGFLISKKNLTPKRLNKYLSRFRDYHKINGLLFLCDQDSINVQERTIEGFYFNPDMNRKENRWVYGKFPYPGAFYKRKSMKKSIYNDLVSVIGDRVFNSYHFNKWELWELLPETSPSHQYLPATEKFQGIEQLERMIEQFEMIYLKPQRGSEGKGIICITKSKQGYIVKESKQSPKVIARLSDLSSYLYEMLDRKYIIQQGIDSTFNDRRVDFRVYMQKNGEMQWKAQGMIARIAKEGSMITNLKYTDQILSGHVGIKKIFNLNDYSALKVEERIHQACYEICSEIDGVIGNYGDLALDVVVDHDYNIWILEVNNKTYGFSSLKKISEGDVFFRCKTTPFEYAKALCGFNH